MIGVLEYYDTNSCDSKGYYALYYNGSYNGENICK